MSLLVKWPLEILRDLVVYVVTIAGLIYLAFSGWNMAGIFVGVFVLLLAAVGLYKLIMKFFRWMLPHINW